MIAHHIVAMSCQKFQLATPFASDCCKLQTTQLVSKVFVTLPPLLWRQAMHTSIENKVEGTRWLFRWLQGRAYKKTLASGRCLVLINCCSFFLFALPLAITKKTSVFHSLCVVVLVIIAVNGPLGSVLLLAVCLRPRENVLSHKRMRGKHSGRKTETWAPLYWPSFTNILFSYPAYDWAHADWIGRAWHIGMSSFFFFFSLFLAFSLLLFERQQACRNLIARLGAPIQSCRCLPLVYHFSRLLFKRDGCNWFGPNK